LGLGSNSSGSPGLVEKLFRLLLDRAMSVSLGSAVQDAGSEYSVATMAGESDSISRDRVAIHSEMPTGQVRSKLEKVFSRSLGKYCPKITPLPGDRIYALP
jgi:hypothetical protein